MDAKKKFQLFGLDEDESKRLEALQKKVAESVSKPVHLEDRKDLTRRLMDDLNPKERRDLLDLRNKFKTQFLNKFPKGDEKEAEAEFYESLEVPKLEVKYQDAQIKSQIYKYADGSEIKDKGEFVMVFRENTNDSIPAARQLQLMSILRAARKLDNKDGIRDAVDSLKRMIDKEFLTNDEAVIVFNQNCHEAIWEKSQYQNADMNFSERLTLDLVMDFAEFLGNDPKKIIFFFEMIKPFGAVGALKRINFDLKAMFAGDLNHLARWVDTILNNSEEQNTRAKYVLAGLGMVQGSGKEIPKELADYKDQCEFLNTMFSDLPAIEGSGEYVTDQDVRDAETYNLNGRKNRVDDRGKYNAAYLNTAGQVRYFSNLFFEIQPDHLNKKRFNKAVFLKVFNLIAEARTKKLDVQLFDDNKPVSVDELERKVQEARKFTGAKDAGLAAN